MKTRDEQIEFIRFNGRRVAACAHDAFGLRPGKKSTENAARKPSANKPLSPASNSPRSRVTSYLVSEEAIGHVTASPVADCLGTGVHHLKQVSQSAPTQRV